MRLYSSAEADREPLRRHRAAARALRDRAGSSSSRPTRCELQIELYERRPERDRLPRAARGVLHLGRELRPARAAGCPSRSSSTSSRPACRSCPTSGSAAAHDSGLYTTIGNWNQPWRDVVFRGERYTWSKDVEFRKFLELPSASGQRVRARACRATSRPIATCSSRAAGRCATDSTSRPTSKATARYLLGSRGEFTVAKDQNVRLKSGWFSDRSAAYLAAGRPVVTQDTGFGCALPTGEGLFAFETVDDVVAAHRDDRGRLRASAPRRVRARPGVLRRASSCSAGCSRTMGVSLPGARTRCRSAAAADARPLASSPGARRRSSSETRRGRPRAADPRYGRRPSAAPATARSRSSSSRRTGSPFTRLCLESAARATRRGPRGRRRRQRLGRRHPRLPPEPRRARLARPRRPQRAKRGFAPAVNQGARRGDAAPSSSC